MTIFMGHNFDSRRKKVYTSLQNAYIILPRRQKKNPVDFDDE